MEETILKRVLAEAFFGETINIKESDTEAVQTIRGELEKENYDAVENDIDKLRQEIERVETAVDNRIQELRISRSETVAAMRRLNDRVGRVSGAKLEALGTLLDDWRWKSQVYSDEDTDIPTLKENARTYGQEMRETFETLKSKLFEEYPPEIRDLVYQMIDDERLSYADLTDEQRRLLADSDVGDYITLRLS
jgi:arginyl-tRNA synthetase